MNTWTPAEIALYDQVLAVAGSELDLLVTMLKIGSAQDGQAQAMANITVWVDLKSKAEITGLLMAALQREASR